MSTVCPAIPALPMVQYVTEVYSRCFNLIERHIKRSDVSPKTLLCRSLCILFLFLGCMPHANAEVILQNKSNETMLVTKVSYNFLGKKWYVQGPVYLRAGEQKTYYEGCCDGNPYIPWRKSSVSYVMIADMKGRPINYPKWSHNKNSICHNPKSYYDKTIDMSDKVGTFSTKVVWASSLFKCKKGEKKIYWLHHIEDSENSKLYVPMR